MSIFISYRRGASSDIVGRIHDWLERDFSREEILRDVDSIPAGVRFWEHLEGQLAGCDLVVAVIGPDWSASDLASEEDFVRQELEFALRRDIPVVPVLVGGVAMPEPSTLPEAVREVADFQAHVVDSGRDFRDDVAELIAALRGLRERAAAERARQHEAVREKLAQEQNEREQAARLDALRGEELDSLTSMLVETTRKRFRAILGVVVAIVLLTGIVAGALWANDVREAKRQEEESRRLLVELEALRGELKVYDRQAEQLTKELENVKDDETRKELERHLEKAQRASHVVLVRGGGLRKAAGADCNCPPGDPLCSCL